MVITTELQEGVCVLRLEGRFATGQDAEYLRAKTEELRNTGCDKIVADFSHVSYIDSTGLGFLIAIYTSVRRNPDGQFAIAGANHRVREVLQLTKLDRILSDYQNVGEAVAALRPPAAEGTA